MATAGDAAAQLVVFRLDEQRYALGLAVVERIVRAVAITPLPNAPHVVLGIIDVAGKVLPVFSLRRRFRLPEREPDIQDQLIVARTAQRTAALLVDAAEGVLEYDISAVVEPSAIATQLDHVQGVIQLEDGLVLIQDLERFLSPTESLALESAMEDGAPDDD